MSKSRFRPIVWAPKIALWDLSLDAVGEKYHSAFFSVLEAIWAQTI